MSAHMFTIWGQPDHDETTAAMALVHGLGLPFTYIDYTKLSEPVQLNWQQQFVKTPTLPIIYLDGALIGGLDQLKFWSVSQDAEVLLAEPFYPPILWQRLSGTARGPERGSDEAAGLDLFADLGIGERLSISPSEVRTVKTGVAMQAPIGTYLRAAPKSGLAIKGLDVMAGVIDRDYRGEIVAVLANHHFENLIINHGQKVVQIVAERCVIAGVAEVVKLPSTQRGAGGFGSTGL